METILVEDMNNLDEKQSKEYFFDSLIHFAFISNFPDNGSSKDLVPIIPNDKLEESLVAMGLGSQISELGVVDLVEKVLTSQEAIDEYLEKLDFICEYIHSKKYLNSQIDELEFAHLKDYYFRINQVNKFGYTFYGIKSVRSEGIESGLKSENEVAYVDLFTVPQVIKENGQVLIIGIQGMMPIVNQRRKLYELSQDNTMLILMHHLKNKLRQDIKDFIVQTKAELTNDTLDKEDGIHWMNLSIENLDRLIHVSDGFLELFKGGRNKSQWFKWKWSLQETKNNLVSQGIDFRIKFDSELESKESSLDHRFIEFLAEAFIDNAQKEYARIAKRMGLPYQEFIKDQFIEVEVSRVYNEKRELVKITFFNSGTKMNEETISYIGLKPITNVLSGRGGLGYFLINEALKHFDAIKDINQNRYFRAENLKNGFQIEFLIDI